MISKTLQRIVDAAVDFAGCIGEEEKQAERELNAAILAHCDLVIASNQHLNQSKHRGLIVALEQGYRARCEKCKGYSSRCSPVLNIYDCPAYNAREVISAMSVT